MTDIIRSYKVHDDVATAVLNLTKRILDFNPDIILLDYYLNYKPCIWVICGMKKRDIPLSALPKNPDFVIFNFLGLNLGKILQVSGCSIAVTDIQKQITPELLNLLNKYTRGGFYIYNIHDAKAVNLKSLT